MLSKTRQDSNEAVKKFMGELPPSVKTCLYVGVAGNPLTHKGKPGPDMPELYQEMEITTLDFDQVWNPDIVADISDPESMENALPNQKFDLIVITQVIEHIANLYNLSDNMFMVLNQNGHVIIDTPWGPLGPDYHAEPPSFGDYWRISKDGMRVLFEDNFHIRECIQTNANVACLLQKR